MVDPTSDLDEDVDESNAPECAVCGTKLVRDPNHHVVTWVASSTVSGSCVRGTTEISSWSPKKGIIQ